MYTIIDEIQASNILKLSKNEDKLTKTVIKYFEDKNTHLTILNPFKNHINLEQLSEYETDVEITNILEQIPPLQNYDVLIVDSTENHHELMMILRAVEASTRTTKFPVIFIMNTGPESVENKDKTVSSDLNEIDGIHADYKDFIGEFTAETEHELKFTYIEINGNGVLYEDDAQLNEFVQRSVDIFNAVETENLKVHEDLEKYKTLNGDLEIRVDEVKTEF
ncbi:MAG: hypothetical protein F8N15_06445 [Methanobacterium sp.]|nr:hypothetical protein [Methanobacterium sp.]